jgi:hypothetical protein
MKNNFTSIILSIFWIFCISLLKGQDTIPLKNPSFEDMPRRGTPGVPAIKDWRDCGWNQFPGESPADIHPVTDNAWGVSMPPYDGDTYLGLVVRASASWESVSQRLYIPLRAGICYSLTAMLALSDTYLSATIATVQARTNARESFAHPIILVIWGGQEECHKQEILAQSNDVANNDWQLYEFILKPRNHYTHIIIEAYYSKSSLAPYNGHIMVDNLSQIIELKCE